MAYLTSPGGQNPAANRYALFRLHQQAALGQITPDEVAAAQQDPAAWWRAYSAAVGGIVPQTNPLTGGMPPNPMNAGGLARVAAMPAAHRYTPAVRQVTPRQAVMNRLTRAHSPGGYGGWMAV